MKVEKMQKKNKQVERKNLLLFHYILNQLKCHEVQRVQEVDHDVVVAPVVVVIVIDHFEMIDHIEMINKDVWNLMLNLNNIIKKIFLLAKSPSQQQAPLSQQTGEHQNDEQQQQQQQQQYQQSRPYRGGSSKLSASENIQIYINLSGQGSGRGEYRRPYGNSARGSRGSYNRSHADPNTPDLDNTTDFPNLAKP
jgi:hypothetical protein